MAWSAMPICSRRAMYGLVRRSLCAFPSDLRDHYNRSRCSTSHRLHARRIQEPSHGNGEEQKRRPTLGSRSCHPSGGASWRRNEPRRRCPKQGSKNTSPWVSATGISRPSLPPYLHHARVSTSDSLRRPLRSGVRGSRLQRSRPIRQNWPRHTKDLQASISPKVAEWASLPAKFIFVWPWTTWRRPPA